MSARRPRWTSRRSYANPPLPNSPQARRLSSRKGLLSQRRVPVLPVEKSNQHRNGRLLPLGARALVTPSRTPLPLSFRSLQAPAGRPWPQQGAGRRRRRRAAARGGCLQTACFAPCPAISSATQDTSAHCLCEADTCLLLLPTCPNISCGRFAVSGSLFRCSTASREGSSVRFLLWHEGCQERSDSGALPTFQGTAEGCPCARSEADTPSAQS